VMVQRRLAKRDAARTADAHEATLPA
jgi:hypothetical protein